MSSHKLNQNNGNNNNNHSATMANMMTMMQMHHSNNNSNAGNGGSNHDDSELKEWERRLNEAVDEDFFAEPKKFNTLHRVIDVLGLQMIDDATVQSSHHELVRNPAYLHLKKQETIVEGAIEHMAVIHCADLNGSVIQVGQVARQFNQAVSKVRQLRKQVRDIQDTLGNHAANPNEASVMNAVAVNRSRSGASVVGTSSSSHNAAAMSLRELWLKKLECEAVLALLEKLDIIRAAPALFDTYAMNPSTPCRIGAAVLTLSKALATMFSDDVAQVQALHKIMEQLMLRKQKAEEILWETVSDVLYLRTGNGLALRNPTMTTTSSSNLKKKDESLLPASASATGHTAGGSKSAGGGTGALFSSAHSISSDTNSLSKPSLSSAAAAARRSTTYAAAAATAPGGTWTPTAWHARTKLRSSLPTAGVTYTLHMVNPFDGQAIRFAAPAEDGDDAYDMDDDESANNRNDEDGDGNTVRTTGSGASLFSLEDDEDAPSTDDRAISVAAGAAPAAETASHVDGKVSTAGTVTSIRRLATATTSTGTTITASTTTRMMIPAAVLQAALDLEADERRCLEEVALSGLSSIRTLRGSAAKTAGMAAAANALTNRNRNTGGSNSRQRRHLPRYADPVLALRILVECLTHLGRLDDVERVLQEGLEREIRWIVQREQSRTFARLERKRTPQSMRLAAAVTSTNNSSKMMETLHDFRRHLTGLLSAFGCVLLRLSHLAEILRYRIHSDKDLMHKIESPSTVMRSVLTSAIDIMQRELKEFFKACLYPSEAPRNDPIELSMRKGPGAVGINNFETGLFSLGIVDSNSSSAGLVGGSGGGLAVSTATRSNVMQMTVQKFVVTILFGKTKSAPQVRHALTFRRCMSRWTSETEAMQLELAALTGEDASAPSYRAYNEEPAISFLDTVIQNELLPVLQEEAVNGTVQGLERRDAFDPVLDRALYARPQTSHPADVDMCRACQVLYEYTGPLFLALHRLPAGGTMYLPLVAVLEHVMLTFISRVKQQVATISNKKTALMLLMQEGKDESLANVMERRKPFSLLLQAYASHEALEAASGGASTGGAAASVAGDDALLAKATGLMPLAPPVTDTPALHSMVDLQSDAPVEDIAEGIEGEEKVLEKELTFLQAYLDFANVSQSSSSKVTVCSDEEVMRAACLAHSLLKLSSGLEARLQVRGRMLTSTRALREAIKTIKMNGIKLAKFCRLDMLMQSLVRMSKVCTSSTLVARDAVRIPSSVNDLGEYLTGASDNLREAAGNAVTAYTFSSLEQYIPLFLIQTVRVIAVGKGVVAKSPLTMNGIEALDRSGSVLYRDLKGAVSFDNSFWDVELAAISFERSASFMAMMELEMEEMVAYYTSNYEDFSDKDFELMFSMTGPRRRGDPGRFHLAKKQLKF